MGIKSERFSSSLPHNSWFPMYRLLLMRQETGSLLGRNHRFALMKRAEYADNLMFP